MADHRDKPKPIVPPDKNHPDDKVRTAFEAAVEVVPFVSSITKLTSDLIPTQARRATDKWEKEISHRTNEHADRLDEHEDLIAPKTDLTGVAVTLAVALARDPNCDGMRGRRPRDLDALCKLVPDEPRQEVEDAAFELNMHGLCKIDRGLNNWWLFLTQNFYEQLDHQVMGWDSTTEHDARSLARLILDKKPSGRTSELHALSGWDKRRFNPAFQYLLRFIPDGRVSKELQAEYPSSSIVIMQEDRAALRAFVGAK